VVIVHWTVQPLVGLQELRTRHIRPRDDRRRALQKRAVPGRAQRSDEVHSRAAAHHAAVLRFRGAWPERRSNQLAGRVDVAPSHQVVRHAGVSYVDARVAGPPPAARDRVVDAPQDVVQRASSRGR